MVSLIQNSQNVIFPLCPFGAKFYHWFFFLYILNTGLGIFSLFTSHFWCDLLRAHIQRFNDNIATLRSMHGDQYKVFQDIRVSTINKSIFEICRTILRTPRSLHWPFDCQPSTPRPRPQLPNPPSLLPRRHHLLEAVPFQSERLRAKLVGAHARVVCI